MGNLILDLETISMEYNQTCDIAWGTIERNKLVSIKNFIVQEHLALMLSGCFSKDKMAKTLGEVVSGRAIIAPWADIMEELKADFSKIKYSYAYNASFDRGKIISTCKALGDTANAEWFERSENFDKWRDLWAWSTNSILYKKSFIDFCLENKLVTEKGNCSTTAETALKFIRRDLSYSEQHTALEDVLDEFQIYLAIKRELKCEYSDHCEEENEKASFRGKPFYNVMKLKKAINT